MQEDSHRYTHWKGEDRLTMVHGHSLERISHPHWSTSYWSQLCFWARTPRSTWSCQSLAQAYAIWVFISKNWVAYPQKCADEALKKTIRVILVPGDQPLLVALLQIKESGGPGAWWCLLPENLLICLSWGWGFSFIIWITEFLMFQKVKNQRQNKQCNYKIFK